MPTLTFKATEMKDAKVAHISLVDRAATRIPFKVIKQEKPMNVIKHLDLASVFKKEKPVETPTIVGVITMKSDGFESIKAQFEAAGVNVEKAAEMEDGSVLFGQASEAEMAGQHTLIRLSENAVLAVKGFSPYSMGMQMADGASFAEVCKAQGFYPGVGTMVDVLRSSVLQVAEKSENAATAATEVAKMFDEAKQYAVSMIGALPSMAFKLESIYPEEAKVEDPVIDPVVADPVADPVVVDKACAPEGKEHEGDDADMSEDDMKKKMKAKKEEGDASLTAEAVTTIVADSLKEFTVKMEGLFAGVTKSVTDMGTEVKTLGGRVESAEAVAKAAKDALQGTVVLSGAGEGGDHNAVNKQDGAYRGREIDTGFAPSRRRSAAAR